MVEFGTIQYCITRLKLVETGTIQMPSYVWNMINIIIFNWYHMSLSGKKWCHSTGMICLELDWYETIWLVSHVWNWFKTDTIQLVSHIWNWLKLIPNWYQTSGIGWIWYYSIGIKCLELMNIIPFNWYQISGTDWIQLLLHARNLFYMIPFNCYHLSGTG